MTYLRDILQRTKPITIEQMIEKKKIIFADTCVLASPSSNYQLIRRITDQNHVLIKKEREEFQIGNEKLEIVYNILQKSDVWIVKSIQDEIREGIKKLKERVYAVNAALEHSKMKGFRRSHSREYSAKDVKELKKLGHEYQRRIEIEGQFTDNKYLWPGDFLDLKEPLHTSIADSDLCAASYAAFVDNTEKIGIFTADKDIINIMSAYYLETPKHKAVEFNKRVQIYFQSKETHNNNNNNNNNNNIFPITPIEYFRNAPINLQDAIRYRDYTVNLKLF